MKRRRKFKCQPTRGLPQSTTGVYTALYLWSRFLLSNEKIDTSGMTSISLTRFLASSLFSLFEEGDFSRPSSNGARTGHMCGQDGPPPIERDEDSSNKWIAPVGQTRTPSFHMDEPKWKTVVLHPDARNLSKFLPYEDKCRTTQNFNTTRSRFSLAFPNISPPLFYLINYHYLKEPRDPLR